MCGFIMSLKLKLTIHFLFRISNEKERWTVNNHQVLNAFHAAGESRRQVKKLTKFVKNAETVELHDHIWNHHEKCIQISTNMPVIGSQLRKIGVQISEI